MISFAVFSRISGLLLDRTLDTFEDVALHCRRTTEERVSFFTDMTVKKSHLPRVVICGTGWGGHAIVKIIDTKVYDTLCISPTNHFIL